MTSKKRVARPSKPGTTPKKPDQKPSSLTSSPLLNLQQKAGNRAVGVMLQKKAQDGQTENEPPETAAAPSLIVADDMAETTPGQMRKSEFLAALQPAVCSATDEALAGTGRDSEGCPYIARWFDYYQDKDSSHIERAIHKYAPETRRATTARQYIPAVTARVRRGVKRWAATGEISDVPEELVAALSGGGLAGLVSSIGRGLSAVRQALFKRRAGAVGPQGDPMAIQVQLGDGRSLDGGVRSRMESAFGTSFAHVRLHDDTTAAGLSSRLNTRAFTVGEHVAFGSGEYRPGTPIGDALIAHELAHVVQQGRGQNETAVAPLTKSPGAGYQKLEEDADQTAVNAVLSLWSGKPGALQTVDKKTMPQLRSGLRLQRCATTPKKVKAPAKEMTKEERERARFRSAGLARREENLEEAGTLLREVGRWASLEQKKQGRPEITGVAGLDPKQRENASQAISKIKSAESQFDTIGLDDVSTRLKQAVTKAKDAKKFIGREEREFQMQMRITLYQADESLDEAVSALEKLRDSVDGYELWVAIEKARETLEKARNGEIDAFDGIESFSEAIKDIRAKIREIQRKYQRYPAALARIRFVVQHFVSVNTPGSSGAPSPEEIKKFRGSLEGNLSGDFALVFGGSGVHSPFELFISYADILDKQLAVRNEMAEAGKPAATPIPSQGEVESYFQSLRNKPNDEVKRAYEQYAQAYFYHRLVANIDDMNVKSVADLYKRPLSIAGTRPLVCSGYAMVGAHLLVQAGAKLNRFINAVRATDEDIRNNRIDEGHTIAILKRKGETFIVSNDLIVGKIKEGIGPDAVAWAKRNAPLYTGSGATNAASLKALKKVLMKKANSL